jgi:hypothetical protein
MSAPVCNNVLQYKTEYSDHMIRIHIGLKKIFLTATNFSITC